MTSDRCWLMGCLVRRSAFEVGITSPVPVKIQSRSSVGDIKAIDFMFDYIYINILLMGSKCDKVSVDDAWRVLYISKADGKKAIKHAIKAHKPKRYTIYETPDYFVLAIGRPPLDVERLRGKTI